MRRTRTVVVQAPAKINLGLEILGKREDGFHEIRTILAAINLTDILSITIVPDRLETRISGVTGVLPADNLIQKAVDAFGDETGFRYGYDIEVEKHIPSPGGLGGASSDAASTLMALNATHGTPLPTERMGELASGLGSDVPFFIASPAAVASGTGTILTPLPPVRFWVVLIVPQVNMSSKTPTLYAALHSRDFSDGSRVKQAAEAIRNGNIPDPHLLINAFTRPLYELQPELAILAQSVVDAGAPNINVSGAGPGHFVLLPSERDAIDLMGSLRSVLPDGVHLNVYTNLTAPTSVELSET